MTFLLLFGFARIRTHDLLHMAILASPPVGVFLLTFFYVVPCLGLGLPDLILFYLPEIQDI